MASSRLRAPLLCVLLLLAVDGLRSILAQQRTARDRDPVWVAPATVTSSLSPLVNRPEAAP